MIEMNTKKIVRTMRRTALSSALSFCQITGICHFISKRFGGIGNILTFHSIVKSLDQELGQDIHVSENMLRLIVMYLRENNREIITLDQAVERMSSTQVKPFTVLTFDDGYKNNLTRALPILEELNAPFTIFVNSAMMNGEIYAWWLALRSLILNHDKITVESMFCQFTTKTLIEKRKALFHITNWVHEDISIHSQELNNLFKIFNINLSTIIRQEALDANDVRLLSKHPLVSIGGHAQSHLPLSTLSNADALSELTQNKNMLEELIDTEVRHLAYPFGDSSSVGIREVQLAKKAGFKTAVTSQTGNIFKEHANLLLTLPRLAVVNHNSISEVGAKLAGSENFIRNPFSEPIVSL
jgi:peptidoglycan/xylan/chitin deacetylase (PgdA/CDA1 family)